MRKLLLAAAGIAATLALTQAPARASLVFTPTTFNGNQAVIDDTSHVTWVTPNIASGDDFATNSGLCNGVGGACHGALAGLTWASDAEVNTFMLDVGIPLSNMDGSINSAFAGA